MNNFVAKLISFCLAWMFVAVMPICHAEESKSVATIVRAIENSTIISDSGQERIAGLRAPIYSKDTIITGELAWLTINFFDLTRLILRPNTQLIVHKFPETMSSGDIVFEILSGGVRVTTGTVASRSPERFKMITPKGEVTGGRSEWVIRICSAGDCDRLEQSFSRCSGYRSLDKQNRQFVAVYKGEVDLGHCPQSMHIDTGETAVFHQQAQTCDVIDEIPCFILSDGQMGRDKLRLFQPKLTPIPSEEARKISRPAIRPNSRSSQPRPRLDRPRRNRRGP